MISGYIIIIDGHEYYLAEGSGAPVYIYNNETDITLYDEEGECKSMPAWRIFTSYCLGEGILY